MIVVFLCIFSIVNVMLIVVVFLWRVLYCLFSLSFIF